MSLSEYLVLFVFVAIMGAGLPGPGDAALIAAGCLAGEGRSNIWIVLATAMTAWMLGSVIGFKIGIRKGRRLLDHPGRLEKSRRKLLAKGDGAFGRHTFAASVTMPAFRVWNFPGAVLRIRARSAHRWRRLDRDVRRAFVPFRRRDRDADRKSRHESGDQRDRDRRPGTVYQGRGVEVAQHPACTTSRTRCSLTRRLHTRGRRRRSAARRPVKAAWITNRSRCPGRRRPP